MSSPPDPRPRWLPFVLGSIAAAVAIYLLFVWTRTGQRIDESALSRHRYDRTPDRDLHWADLLLLAGAIGLLPLVVWRGRRTGSLLAACGVGVVASVVIAQALRKLLLTRPNLLHVVPPPANSFPSGHAAVAMAVALSLLAVSEPGSAFARRAAVATTAWVGAGSVYVPNHRLSDVLAGYLIALACMTASVGVLAPPLPRSEDRPRTRFDGRDAFELVILWVVLLAVGEVAAQPAEIHLVDFGEAFLASSAVVVAAAAAVVGVWPGLLHDAHGAPPVVDPGRGMMTPSDDGDRVERRRW